MYVMWSELCLKFYLGFSVENELKGEMRWGLPFRVMVGVMRKDKEEII